MNAALEQRLSGLAGTELLAGSRRGIEKESLRISPAGTIAESPHPGALGSALTNRYITTDFSEALIEFITPPLDDVWQAIQFLCDLHQFTAGELEDERLWALSMPCRLRSAADIRLARYGTSNVGRMKTIYRRGLGYRYGRHMQAISGIHYNWSLPDEFWPRYHESQGSSEELQAFRSAAYMGMVRNIRRYGWLMLYLFGASPAVCASFIGEQPTSLSRLDAGTLYAPYATSLRMGEIGYQNARQARLRVSANSLREYIADLDSAIRTENPDYRNIGILVDGEYRQLNANELQIENEYYTGVRPKRVARSGERPSAALARGGVQYIELRLLDVSPFDPVGISARQARVVETFLLTCLLSDSPPIDAEGAAEDDHNRAQVALSGRDPELRLTQGKQQQPMLALASRLLDHMTAAAELLDPDSSAGYRDAVSAAASLIDDPQLTPSARLLQDLRDQQLSLADYGQEISRRHKDYFLALPPSLNQHLDDFKSESAASLQRQTEIEAADSMDFASYLRDYYA